MRIRTASRAITEYSRCFAYQSFDCIHDANDQALLLPCSPTVSKVSKTEKKNIREEKTVTVEAHTRIKPLKEREKKKTKSNASEALLTVKINSQNSARQKRRLVSAAAGWLVDAMAASRSLFCVLSALLSA